MSKKIEMAKGLYTIGIRDGNIKQAMSTYVGDVYRQHSTGVKDGKEGFETFFEDFIERNPIRDIRISTAIEEDNMVFLSAYQNLNSGENEWLTTDLFLYDNNDHIIEHWDVIDRYRVSEPNLFLGDIDLGSSNKEVDSNKAMISRLLRYINGGNYGKIKTLVNNRILQHSKVIDSGLESYLDYLIKYNISYPMVKAVIAQGNYVVTYAKMIFDNDDYAIFDIYKIEKGQVVEHWENKEKILPKEEWVNSGKF